MATCAARREAEPSAPGVSTVMVSASVAAPEPAVSSAEPIASASAPAPASSGPPRVTGGKLELPLFHGALQALAKGERADHVRVLWLGDSHTAADIWSGAVRKGLQKGFGDGGPGFLRIGWDVKHYRHEALRIGPTSHFSTEPATYAQSTKEDDGIFGLGGIRFRAQEDTSTTIGTTDAAMAEQSLRWDLAYRLKTGTTAGAISIGKTQGTMKPDASPKIVHFTATTAPGSTDIAVRVPAGGELFGVTIEGEKPGVVLDTVGLNGARIATMLAWDKDAWQAEVARRKPDLVVVAFGTNESQQTGDPARFGRHLTELVGRVRAAQPNVECLVILPMDRKDPEAEKRIVGIGEALRAAAGDLKCATWSAFDAMGGLGSMATWIHESPPRGAADGVHLFPRGYQFLGERLASDLIN